MLLRSDQPKPAATTQWTTGNGLAVYFKPHFIATTDFHSPEAMIDELSGAILWTQGQERPSPVIPAYDPNACSFWEIGDTDNAISGIGAT